MKSIEIESWALRVLERVENHQPAEDSRVELKAEWPGDYAKTARQLAGHANAARGENLLWLIGADEARGIVGANNQELSDWLAKLQSPFDSLYPALERCFNVPYKDKTVVALCFDTSRVPYVVRNPAFGKPEGGPAKFEVPWREGNSTRSATRSDLVLLLAPLVRMPKIEILKGHVAYTISQRTDDSYFACTLDLYFVPLDGSCLTFPFHKVNTALSGAGELISENFSIHMGSWASITDEHNMMLNGLSDRYEKLAGPSDNIQATEDELFVKGAGRIAILADTLKPHRDVPNMHLSLTLVEALSEMRILLAADFKQTDACTWEMISATALSQ
jgi:hypothetical protein